MMEEMDGYKEDLDRQISILRDGLSKLDRAKDERKGNIIAGLESALRDAKASYGSFDTAYREMEKTIQPKYQPVGIQFKKDLTVITDTLKAHRIAQDRKDLNLGDDQSTTIEILDMASKVQSDSKKSTARSKIIVQEIEATGKATLDQLTADRAKLDEVATDLEEIDSDLKIAQNQLKSIARKLTKDKIIRGLCLLACLIILTALIVMIVKRNKTKGGKATT